MEFYDVINKRRTIRDFENAEIDDKVIERIINAAMKAPTNDHMRDWHFVVINDKNIIEKLIMYFPKNVTRQDMENLFQAWNLKDKCQQECYLDAVPKQYKMFANSSCMIIPLLKEKNKVLGSVEVSSLNGFASIWCAIENLFLSTTAEGYASCLRIPLGDEGERAREVLSIPNEYFIPCFIGIGKTKKNASIITQKEIDTKSRIHQNKW